MGFPQAAAAQRTLTLALALRPLHNYVDTTNLQGEDLVGIHVERLNVEVVDGVGVYVTGSQYSIPRLKEHFGKDLCWPVVVSNKRSVAVTCCPCKGQPGHEVEGHMHQIDRDKKGDFIK